MRVANWNRIVLVGHSVGGSLALQMLSGGYSKGLSLDGLQSCIEMSSIQIAFIRAHKPRVAERIALAIVWVSLGAVGPWTALLPCI